MNPDIKHDLAVQAANSGPSLAFVAVTLAGIGLQDWLAITGIAFILLQAAYLLWKWWRDARIERERKQSLLASRYVEDEDDPL